MPVVESIGVAAPGWVAFPLLEKLLNEGFASLGIDAEEKLQTLRATVLPVLKSVVEKAEGSPHRSEVEGWLQRLKDAYDGAEDALDLLHYDRLKRKAAGAARNGAEDALDLLHYDRLKRKAAGAARSRKRRINRVRFSLHIPKPVKLKGGLDMLSPRKIKLKRRLNELEKIAGEAEKLRTLLGAQPDQTAAAAPDSRQSISLPPPPQKVFGRDEDRVEIIRRLKIEPAAGVPIPIIAVVGRPGVGKTILAQYVCKQLWSELGGWCFDLVMWVHASRNFSASKIMKDIIQQASIASEPQEDLCDLSSPEALRLKLNEKLNEKKFLLVIDDVWCDREDGKKNWDALFRCLSKCCCLPGSKILVTSQTDDAPRKIAAAGGAAVEYICHLEDLEEDDFADLFIHHALPSGEIDSRLREELEEKCKTIAEKLNKDPTAAEMVGETIAVELADLLCSQGDWRTYLETIAQKDWSGGTTKALTWSYQHLPAHLQRCFSYCSLYPRGHMFEALELVQLWMAQGFIKPDDQNEREEDAGDGYLNELVSRFYIHQSHDGYYTLHKLLYNLATKVSSSVCLRVEGKKEKIPSTIRHLYIPADKLNENEEEICKLKKLLTLIVTKGESIVSDENVATDISNSLKKFSLKKLRVLVLELNLKNLAKFMSGMKHLRILRVSGTREFVLPESVSTLYQLQVLKVESARSLPEFLNNLISLRYLEPSDIADIGKLTSLQRLENFQVRKEKGYELEQLQNLNKLRGCLHIDNLENVESKESAIAANLKEKKHLDTLQLVWHNGEDNVNSYLDAEILAGLQLPPNLITLHLNGYRGRSWPSWPENQIGNIKKLELEQCRMLEELPPMDQLYPYCRSLELSHLSRLEALHTLPPRLQEFTIIRAPFLTFVTREDLRMSPADKRSIIKVMRERMPKWFPHQFLREMRNFIAATNGSECNEASSREHNESVPAADADITAVQERWLEVHERKTKLIYSRPNEAKLLLPSTLIELRLEGCNITNRALSACLQTLTSLTKLLLVDLKMITCLPSVDALAKLKSLHTLWLDDCWALTSLGGIGSLPCLRKLILIGCPCLDIKTAVLPPSLQYISLKSCAVADVILANANLPHLSLLTITQCHTQTASLQFRNLRSLHSLTIQHCSGLSSLVDLQELHSLGFLILENCPKLQSVTNLPMSIKSLVIHECPLLERGSVKTDLTLGISHSGELRKATISDEFAHVNQEFINTRMPASIGGMPVEYPCCVM